MFNTTKLTLAGATAIAALAVPAGANAFAVAGSPVSSGGPISVAPSPTSIPTLASTHQRLDQLQSNVQQYAVGRGGSSPLTGSLHSSAPVVRATSGGGFQWDDAGIGAAGAMLLLGTGAAGATAVRRRTQRAAIS